MKLSNYKGQGVLLVFSTTWCSYCRKEIPQCPSINGIFRPPAAFSLVFNPRNSALCLSEIP
ncbi:MAG: redoxin domain-containing protein [Deltaproteobacteria bacterium]|nr:redoxin domain-containing protein [Deltaproteobacteria bacterium]MBW2087380.1 redoxin domain-containing protein [Deltaproteobacteria bacterium]